MKRVQLSAMALALISTTGTAFAATDQGPSQTPATNAPANANSTPTSRAPNADPVVAQIALPAPGPTVAYVKHAAPPVMSDLTTGKAMFAALGAIAAISAGKELAEKDGIEDPSNEIGRKIAEAFAATRQSGLVVTPIQDEKLWERAKTEKLADLSKGANYLVEVTVPHLLLSYFSLDWAHYDVSLGANVRIIDTSNASVIATAKCGVEKEKANAKSHEEFVANSGAELKRTIQRKADECVAQMKSTLKL